MKNSWSYFRVYWSMHVISLVLSIIITIIYWSLLYKGIYVQKYDVFYI